MRGGNDTEAEEEKLKRGKACSGLKEEEEKEEPGGLQKEENTKTRPKSKRMKTMRGRGACHVFQPTPTANQQPPAWDCVATETGVWLTHVYLQTGNADILSTHQDPFIGSPVN